MIRLPDPLAYPVRGDRPGDTVVAAWVLLLVHGIVPVVPLVPLAGVLLGVLADAARGVDEPPSVVDDLPRTLREGVGAGGVVIAFAGLPLGYLLAVLRLVSGSGALERGSLAVLVAATVGGFTLLVAAYLLPIGLVRYASTGSVRAAFDGGRLRQGSRSGRYLLGWLAGVVVLDVGWIVAAGLAGAGAVGAVLAALVGGYALVVGARLVGLGLTESGIADAEPRTAAETRT